MRINALLLFCLLLSFQLQGQKNDKYTIEAMNQLLAKSASFGNSSQVDSAYHYALQAQRIHRKLSNRDKKKLEREGINTSHFSKLKRKFTEEALEMAIGQNTSAAIDTFLLKYPRLKFTLAQQARQKRNELFFAEQQEAGNYETLLAFLEDNRLSLQENSPALIPKLEEAVVKSFVKKYPEPSMRSLFTLMNRYPRLSPFMDESMAKLVERNPFVYLFEDQLRLIDNSYIPKTIQALYPYYACYGVPKAFERFYSHFPTMIDSVSYRDDFALAREVPAFRSSMSREDFIQYIKKAGPSHRSFQAIQLLSQGLIQQQDWAALSAKISEFEGYYDSPDPTLKGFREIINAAAETVVSRSFGDQVNTIDAEYSPVVTVDGQTLYFCRLINGVENIYTSQREGDKWGTAMPIKRFNTSSNEAPLAVSADGNSLILFINGQVMISEKQVKGWTQPLPFFTARQKSVWQGGTTISADEKVVIFAARRPDRVGLTDENNTDLYISYRLPDESWSKPQNLGTTINTPWEDRSPFLHPDMRTLYFSSGGHPGLGGLDVFKTTRIGESWTEWSPPINLGKSINTSANDWGYKVSTDGTEAYFAKQIKDKKEEVYSLLLPDRARPQQVATLAGELLSLKGKPLNFSIIVEDMETGEPAGEIKPDPVTGKFFISLPLGKLYSYRVQEEGYYPISNNIDLRNQTDQVSQLDNIIVPSLVEMVDNNMAIPLKNLFFETAKFTIKPTSFKELERLAQLITEQELIVEISGHTDNVGSPAYNKELSQNRAEATRSFFIEQGVAAQQIIAKGYGLDQPIESNETEEGRAQNRRVEIRFKLPTAENR